MSDRDEVDSVIEEMRDRAAIGLNTLILRDWADRLSAAGSGGRKPEPSDEACEVSFQHWWEETRQEGWDGSYTTDLWREVIEAAYAVDFGLPGNERETE